MQMNTNASLLTKVLTVRQDVKGEGGDWKNRRSMVIVDLCNFVIPVSGHFSVIPHFALKKCIKLINATRRFISSSP